MARYDFSELSQNVVQDVMNSLTDTKDVDLKQIQLIAILATQAAILTLVRTGLLPDEYKIEDDAE